MYIEASGGAGMLVVSYDKRKVLRRLIPFQLIGILIVSWLLRLQFGGLQASSPQLIKAILVTGLAMFGFFTYIMVKIIRDPVLLRIKGDGQLCWNTAFSRRVILLRSGTVVKHGRQHVSVTPAVDGIPHARSVNGSTQVTLPSGLKEIHDGEFIINARA